MGAFRFGALEGPKPKESSSDGLNDFKDEVVLPQGWGFAPPGSRRWAAMR